MTAQGLWWQTDGIVANADGALLWCDVCPCGTGGFETTTCGTLFSEIAAVWEFTLALSDAACPGCAANAGTYLVKQVTSSQTCTVPNLRCAYYWVTLPTLTVSANSLFKWFMLCIETTNVRLRGSITMSAPCPFSYSVEWRIATASFDPLGPNILTLFTTPSVCNTMPTVTIEPYAA